VNPDPKSETTADKAMDAWYANSIYFDYNTGKPKAGKETEAYDFLNVINTETTDVGFGVKDGYVLGYFCPKANTDPEALKKNTPREREPPKMPVLPAGTLLKENATCPELDDTGKRPACAEGLCCG